MPAWSPYFLFSVSSSFSLWLQWQTDLHKHQSFTTAARQPSCLHWKHWRQRRLVSMFFTACLHVPNILVPYSPSNHPLCYINMPDSEDQKKIEAICSKYLGLKPWGTRHGTTLTPTGAMVLNRCVICRVSHLRRYWPLWYSLDHCLFPHPAVTEQHDDSFGVVFVSPDECKSNIHPLLALLVSNCICLLFAAEQVLYSGFLQLCFWKWRYESGESEPEPEQ